MESVLKKVPVDSIILDNENPRFIFAKIEKGVKDWSEKVLSEEIKETLSYNNLLDSIEQHGVIDPIWIHDLGNKKFRVIEGNMRVTALKELIKNKTDPPQGIIYSVVQAHVIAKDTPKIDLEVQKAVLQTGKTPWGAFNEAAHIYDLFWAYHIGIDKIANMLGKSNSYVSSEIDNFKFYKQFIDFTRRKKLPIDPRKYSFFKEASQNIRDKFFKSKESREQYFQLITPNEDGITRIPNVSLKGGLKVFSRFVSDEKTLEYFLKNPSVTVEDAYLIFLEKNSLVKRPWIRRISSVTKGLTNLSYSDRKKLKDEAEVMRNLKQLSIHLKRFLNH